MNIAARLFVRPDFNRDYDVDQEDFGHLQTCLTGPFVPQPDPACQDALLDADNDVDQDDVTVFYGCFKGPGVIVSPNCAG